MILEGLSKISRAMIPRHFIAEERRLQPAEASSWVRTE